MTLSTGMSVVAGVMQLVTLSIAVMYTLKGDMKPSTTAYGIWGLVSISLFASSAAAGGITNLPFIAGGLVGCLVLFGLSLKYGYRHWSWIDPVCLILAVLSLIVWYLTNQAAYAVYILTFIDWLALMPVVRKSWKDPDSEHRTVWLSALLTATFLVAAVNTWSLAVIAVAFTQLFSALLIVSLLFWPHRDYRRSAHRV